MILNLPIIPVKPRTLQKINRHHFLRAYLKIQRVYIDDVSARHLGLVVRDLEYLQDLKNQDNTLFHHIDSYYPIQHPSNLNLLQYYHDIFVDIVVEPNVSGNSFLVTEKLWRSIIARRPFIVMSNHNYLVNLKRLGFRTFDNYWDESYDNCKEGDRILKIQGILEQIATWTIPELNTKLIDMQDILEHNVAVFANLSPSKVSEAFNE